MGEVIKVIYYPDGRKLRLEGGDYTNLATLRDLIKGGGRLSVRAFPEYTYLAKDWETEILKKILVRQYKLKLASHSHDTLYSNINALQDEISN